MTVTLSYSRTVIGESFIFNNIVTISFIIKQCYIKETFEKKTFDIAIKYKETTEYI